MRTTRTLLLCAWILWGVHTPDYNRKTGGPLYAPVDSYATLEECTFMQGNRTVHWNYTRFVCLPETVTPNAK